MRYKILIVEDEVLISEHLKSILIEQNHQITDICSSFKDAIKSIENFPPDIALLDIQMHGEDQGIEVAKKLRKRQIPFVFVTSFSDKKTIQSAIREHPIGYILKPFSALEIQEVIDNVIKSLPNNFVRIKHSQGTEKLKFTDIKWIQSENVYLEIHTTKKKFVIREQLNKFLDELPENIFVKVHRSFVVNRSWVNRFDGAAVYIDDTRIPVSKKHKEEMSTF